MISFVNKSILKLVKRHSLVAKFSNIQKNIALRIWGNLYTIICITHKTTTFEMNMVGFPCVIQIHTKFANFNNDLK